MSPDPTDATLLEQIDAMIARTPAEHLPALLAALNSKTGAIAARLVVERGSPQSAPSGPDENIDAITAAQRIGMSADWLYKNANRLPFARRIGRRVLFSARGLDQWNRRQIREVARGTGKG